MNLYRTHSPRWLILVIDLLICLFSILFSYFIRFDFNIIGVQTEIFKNALAIPIYLSIRLLLFLISKNNKRIIRYTSTDDVQKILVVILIGSFTLLFLNFLFFTLNISINIPRSVIVIDFFVSTFILVFSRIFVKILYLKLLNPSKLKSNIAIFGSGESTIITKRALDRDSRTKYKVVAFFDKNKQAVGKKIEGVTVYNVEDFDEILKINEINTIIFSGTGLTSKQKNEIIEICLNNEINILNVPPVEKWINGNLSIKQLKNVSIEDLLGRETIVIDRSNIKNELQDKIILITGAAGSIGSEIVRQALEFNPKKIILADQSETGLYELELELLDFLIPKLKKEKAVNSIVEPVLCDITNKDRMANVFSTFKPEIVFHAAAYKHVPIIENNPSESIRVNVHGTKIIADLSVEYKVKKFVMISTDKAVNPTNIMGASKRIAEMYVQSLNSLVDSSFITTRFGNVLGSNGSVIPRFRKQIETGGPITVTHPEVTRYFMTIPEACQLVLEAGIMGVGGEIYVFDMGESVKIIDLAKKMIQLSGLVLDIDIKIEFSGLRPGEKLYEELLNDSENVKTTHHSKIMIANVIKYDFERVSENINILIDLYKNQKNIDIVKKMKEIVPDFISQNSIYEALDNK